MLTEEQLELAERLASWAEDFAKVKQFTHKRPSVPAVGDVFIGYHADAPAVIIHQLWKQTVKESEKDNREMLLESAKNILLQCATSDSMRRLSQSCLEPNEVRQLQSQYFEVQKHSSLADLLCDEVVGSRETNSAVFLQVTTHSILLSRGDFYELATALGLDSQSIHLHDLQVFDTEQQFCKMLQDVFQSAYRDCTYSTGSRKKSEDQLFLLQCGSGDLNSKLIACARYNIINEYTQIPEKHLNRGQVRIHIVFVIQLPRIPGGCFAGFQGGKWKCYHLDELLPAKEYLPKLSTFNLH